LHRETVVLFQPPYHFGSKVQERRLVHELPTVVCRIPEQVLYARLFLFQGSEHQHCAGRVRHIGRHQVRSQQSAIGVDGNMPLAPLLLCPHLTYPNVQARQIQALEIAGKFLNCH
jgi:hypothetical protein